MNKEICNEYEANLREEFELITGQSIERFFGKTMGKLGEKDWQEAASEVWLMKQNRLAIMDR